jgi:hypothetical protein
MFYKISASRYSEISHVHAKIKFEMSTNINNCISEKNSETNNETYTTNSYSMGVFPEDFVWKVSQMSLRNHTYYSKQNARF